MIVQVECHLLELPTNLLGVSKPVEKGLSASSYFDTIGAKGDTSATGTYCTVWKYEDFSITQNLREINFGASRSSKTAFFPN